MLVIMVKWNHGISMLEKDHIKKKIMEQKKLNSKTLDLED